MDKQKKLLVVVDYQNDFVSGSLGFPGAEGLEEPIVRKIETALSQGWDLIFTFDTHDAQYLETLEGKNLPIPHCLKGSEGWALYGKVKNYQNLGRCIEKPTFGSGELFDLLRQSRYEQIELVGLVSNICVLSNAILCKTALPECEVLVDAACTLCANPAMQEKVLDVLTGVQVKVINRKG